MRTRSTPRRILRALPAVALLLAAMPGTAQQPEQQAGEWFIGKPIRAVEFVGLDTVDEGELRPIVDPYLGQPFEYELYFEMEAALYATELFEVLEADAADGDEERSTVIVRLSVQERPTIADIVIEGERRIREGQILNVIASEADTILNSGRLDEDLDAIRNLYEADGFVSARVEATVVPDAAANRVTVRISITEGIRTTVVAIEFVGNEFASAGTLRSQMETRERALLQRGLFSERAFQRDLDSLVSY